MNTNATLDLVWRLLSRRVAMETRKLIDRGLPAPFLHQQFNIRGSAHADLVSEFYSDKREGKIL